MISAVVLPVTTRRQVERVVELRAAGAGGQQAFTVKFSDSVGLWKF